MAVFLLWGRNARLKKKSIEKFSLCNTYTNEECIREDTLLYFLNFANNNTEKIIFYLFKW